MAIPTRASDQRYQSHAAPPANVTVRHEPNTLVIEWRWLEGRRDPILLLVPCILWFALVVAKGSFFDKRESLAAILVNLFVALIAIGLPAVLSWLALCGLMNRTQLLVQAGVLRARDIPIPWPGRSERTLAVDQIEELFVNEVEIRPARRRSTYSVITGKVPRVTYLYELWALVRPDSRKLKLAGRMKLEHANFVKQTVEEFLQATGTGQP